MIIRRVIVTIALLTGAAARAGAVPVLPTPTILTVAAEGRVTRAPDIAEVSGGVVTSAPTAAAAMAENAIRMTAVVAAVKKAGIADRDIQTSGLNLHRQPAPAQDRRGRPPPRHARRCRRQPDQRAELLGRCRRYRAR